MVLIKAIYYIFRCSSLIYRITKIPVIQQIPIAKLLVMLRNRFVTVRHFQITGVQQLWKIANSNYSGSFGC